MVLSLLATASMVGSVTGTVAWYQYSTRASVSFSGASAKCTESLSVRIYRAPVAEDLANGVHGDEGYKTAWKSNLRVADVQAYLNNVRTRENDAGLTPVTTGELAEYQAAEAFYKNPKPYYPSMESWGKATLDDYVELPLQFRVEEVSGSTSTEREYLAKNVYLTDLTLESTADGAAGKKDITDALRVSLDATSDVTFSSHGKDVNVYSALDVNGDGELDQVNSSTGNDYDFDGDRAEIVYGDDGKVAKSTKSVKADFGNSWVIDGADTGIAFTGERSGTYFASAEKAYEDVVVYTYDDGNGTSFSFVAYSIGGSPVYEVVGAGAHTIAYDGSTWTIDGAAVDASTITENATDGIIYKLTDSDNNVTEVTYAQASYRLIGSDAAVAVNATYNTFVVDSVETGLAVPTDAITYAVKSIALVSGTENVFEATLADGSSTFRFSEEYGTASPLDMVYADVTETGHAIERLNYEGNRTRYLADDTDVEHVIGSPLGTTVPWTVGSGAMADDDWFSVTVRIYLEGWQLLDPTDESAVEIESNSLTKAEILALAGSDKLYIASDDDLVYAYDEATSAWAGSAAEADAVYLIGGIYYVYSEGGITEISPADAGSYFTADGMLTAAEITALTGMADGDTYVGTDTNMKYVYDATNSAWVISALTENDTFLAGGVYYALKAASWNARAGGSIWNSEEYVDSSFNVGMTFSVDAY